MAGFVRQFTALDEWRMWWALHGELHMDVVTYYGICAANGAYSGWWIGNCIVEMAW